MNFPCVVLLSVTEFNVSFYFRITVIFVVVSGWYSIFWFIFVLKFVEMFFYGYQEFSAGIIYARPLIYSGFSFFVFVLFLALYQATLLFFPFFSDFDDFCFCDYFVLNFVEMLVFSLSLFFLKSRNVGFLAVRNLM